MNKKGFTLIEIIVGIAIGSILLAVAGSMIVSSYKTVYDTTDTDMDKRVVDSAAEVVRTDTQFCFDVRLVSEGSTDVPDVEHEEGWHWIYVKDGQLYRDDQLLFDSSYYNNKSIKIKANIFVKNDVRVDFNYYLVDRNGKDVYSTRDTLLYLNIQADNLHKGIYNAENAVELSNDDINGNTDNTKYRLYYRNVMSEVIVPDPNPDPKPDPVPEKEEDYTLSEGMVTEGNYMEEYAQGRHFGYKKGSVVFHNGSYWQLIVEEYANLPPGKHAKKIGWRKLNIDFAQNSYYLKNDVVLYNNTYYRANTDIVGESPDQSNQWIRVGSKDDSDILEKLKELQSAEETKIQVIEPYIETVQNKYWPKSCAFTDVRECGYNKFNLGTDYEKGSYVIDDNGILYYKGFKTITDYGPGNASSGWIKLSLFYDANSSYCVGDVIADTVTSNKQLIYKSALKQVDVSGTIGDLNYWEIVMIE